MDNKNKQIKGREFGEYIDVPTQSKSEKIAGDGQIMFGSSDPNEYSEVVKPVEPEPIAEEVVEVGPNVSLADREIALQNVMRAFNQTNKTYGFIEHDASIQKAKREGKEVEDDLFNQYGERIGRVGQNMKKKSNNLYRRLEDPLNILADNDGMKKAGFTDKDVYEEKKFIFNGLKKEYGPGWDSNDELIADSKKRKLFLDTVRTPQAKVEEKQFKESKVIARNKATAERRVERLAEKEAVRAIKLEIKNKLRAEKEAAKLAAKQAKELAKKTKKTNNNIE